MRGLKWSKEELEYVKTFDNTDVSLDEISNALYKKFGRIRNRNAIRAVLYKQGINPKGRDKEIDICLKGTWTYKGKPIGKKHWLWKGVWQYE